MSQDPILPPTGAPDFSDNSQFSEEQIETARVFFAQPVSFIMGAVRMDAMPPADLPEVAFAGRSNVGKSSLINGLVGQKYLARASNEPGRTREINFFLLAEQVRLVDLPGYGFARVSRSIADKFQDLGRAYLRGRPNLKRVYVLIDARHGLKKVDLEALDALDVAAVSYQIVLTKADKIKPAEVDKVVADTLKAIAKRPAAFPRVLATSSEKGLGMPELRAEIVRLCIDE
ncbi:ribosome biogenesis GTP-binding protein YihA/YsxC [Caulobacter sp. RL271]|jgi:GTP-binding protein|uniref:Probable GTP-binding protein EngB n=1 Tax=Caulobacter segnis TaxID=88688 RepID=A0ABY4ZT31_9CAUL|nr:ribosome biogenesis GTP-binding protein YihA/YsxC [Caulobacter segnis]USQ95157.1 ribosome biogenesis GTP-binding protein YihA/YsxC [Caulobacter segnis]